MRSGTSPLLGHDVDVTFLLFLLFICSPEFLLITRCLGFDIRKCLQLLAREGFDIYSCEHLRLLAGEGFNFYFREHLRLLAPEGFDFYFREHLWPLAREGFEW